MVNPVQNTRQRGLACGITCGLEGLEFKGKTRTIVRTLDTELLWGRV